MGRTTEQIEKEYEKALEESNKWFQDAPDDLDWNEFNNYMSSTYDKVNRLSRELRMSITPEFEDLPIYGNVMTLDDFLETCRDGGFIDSDGSGNYVKNNKMSNINIYPSDILYDTIRTDFDTIIWFNK